MGFYLEIPLYNQFHTFLEHFHTFFSHLQIFNIDHNNHLYKCYKNIQGSCGFLFENSSISTISHLFWAFSHLFFTPPKFSVWTMITAYASATRIYKVIVGFYSKIPLYQPFHTFLGVFTPFFSHLQIFNIDHNNHPYMCYKNI